MQRYKYNSSLSGINQFKRKHKKSYGRYRYTTYYQKMSKKEYLNSTKEENREIKKNEDSNYSIENDKENKIDLMNYKTNNKYSFQENQFISKSNIVNKNNEYYTLVRKNKKESFDKTDDSSNKTSNSSFDEKDLTSNILNSDICNQYKIYKCQNLCKLNTNKTDVNSTTAEYINPKRENTEIMSINIKISENQTIVFKLRRFDDLCNTVQFFCSLHHIKEELVKPIILKTMDAMNQIYSAYNSNLSETDIYLLNQIRYFYNQKI